MLPLLLFSIKYKSSTRINNIKPVRSIISVKSTSTVGHHSVWHSQPCKNSNPKGNALTAAGILLSGFTFQRFKEIIDIANIKSISHTFFYSIQNLMLSPAIDYIYRMHQEEILVKLKAFEGVYSIGDRRCNSLGYNAKYGTYTFLRTADYEIANFVSHVSNAGNSQCLEKYGFIKTFDRLIQIHSNLRKNQSDISHQFDVWHFY